MTADGIAVCRILTPAIRSIKPTPYAIGQAAVMVDASSEAFVGIFSSSLLPLGGPAFSQETEKQAVMEQIADAGGALAAGQLNAALANELGKLIADFTGRGSERSRAFVDQDVVVCLLENGATRAEQTMVAAGRSDLVRLSRDVLQRVMEDELIATVERLTGRSVRLFLSGSSTSGESSVEVFVLEPDHGDPIPGTLG